MYDVLELLWCIQRECVGVSVHICMCTECNILHSIASLAIAHIAQGVFVK